MTVPSIALAQKALDSAKPEEKVRFSGNKSSPWSFKLLVAGTLIAAITAVAQAILNLQGWVIISVALTVIQGIGAYYLHQFGLLEEFDFYLQKLSDKVQEFATDIGLVRTENKKLKESADDFKKAIEENKKVIEEAKQESIKEKERFDQVYKKLSATETKLEELKTYSANIEKTVSSLEAENSKMEKNKAALEADIETLKANVEAAKNSEPLMRQQIDKLAAELKDFQTKNQQLAQANAILTKEKQDIQTGLNSIYQEHQKLKAENEKLTKTLEGYQTVTTEMISISDHMDSNKKEIRAMLSELKDLAELNKLIPLLESLKHDDEIKKKLKTLGINNDK